MREFPGSFEVVWTFGVGAETLLNHDHLLRSRVAVQFGRELTFECMNFLRKNL
jgi:hypothetical protein